jgi:hypothetical protein
VSAYWWWSWALTVVGVTGVWLAGRAKTAGWVVGLSAQGLWVAYALVTEQYGFIASALAFGLVYARNIRAWRKDARVAEMRARLERARARRAPKGR